MDKEILAGDPIAYRAGLDRRDRRLLRLKLEYLEETLAHELLGDEERQELRDRILRLRRRLGYEVEVRYPHDQHHLTGRGDVRSPAIYFRGLESSKGRRGV